MSTPTWPSQPATCLIQGPAGQIETVIHPVPDATQVLLIAHPHPLYGGTLHNKVVHTLARAAVALGITAVRFNFRGVGNSEGVYGEVEGEVADAQAVVDFILNHQPQVQLSVAGFSFGSYIVGRLATMYPCQSVLWVAPPVHYLDYAALNLPRWHLLYGTADEIVPPEALADFAKQQDSPGHQVSVLDSATHFFHGQLPAVSAWATQALRGDSA